MKKARHFLFMVLLILVTTRVVFADDTIRVFYNDKEILFEQSPVVEEGRTLVPLRAIFETLGLEVSYDNSSKTIEAKNSDYNIILVIGDKKAIVNLETKKLDVPAKIVNSYTLVPLRFISESVNLKVDWNGETNTITISDKTEVQEQEINLDDKTIIHIDETNIHTNDNAENVKKSGEYVGSLESDKYHYPDCRFAEKILPENEIWFDYAGEAYNEGYVPCGVCNPPSYR